MSTTRTKTKRATKKSSSPIRMDLHKDPQYDPHLPNIPHLPEPPEEVEHGICRHCNVLPASGMELVLVLVALLFSLSAVLMNSIETIEVQQAAINELESTKGYYVSR